MRALTDIGAGVELIRRSPTAYFAIALGGAILETLFTQAGVFLLAPFILSIAGAYFLIVLATENCTGITDYRRIEWKPKPGPALAVLQSAMLIMVMFFLCMIPFSLVFTMALGPSMPANGPVDEAQLDSMFQTYISTLLDSTSSVLILLAGYVVILAFTVSRMALVPVIAVAWELDFREARKRHAETWLKLRGRVFAALLVLFAVGQVPAIGVAWIIGGPAGVMLANLIDWFVGLALPIAVISALLYRSATASGPGNGSQANS